MAAIVSAPVLQLDELKEFNEIRRRIDARRAHNERRVSYYEAHRNVRDLGISTPPGVAGRIASVVGWPGTVVDALEERLDIIGFNAAHIDLDSLGIQQIWDDNELYREYPGAHQDSMIQGVSFLATSRGKDGEPDPLITVESPTTMSAIYDPRGRRVISAAAFAYDDEGRPTAASLYRLYSTVHVEKDSKGRWNIVHRDDHNLNRVLVRRLVNRPRASRQWGRSEITRDVIYYTDAAMRTILGAEVSREFYSAPQRWIMGAKEESFERPDGSQASPWETYMGRFLALSRDEDDDQGDPKVGQFAPASPTPYIELVQMFSTMVASSSATPPTYFGFVTENPPSADAIRAYEARHVKRAERRCTNFGPEWAGALKDAILLRDGHVPAELAGLRTNWADPATPTRAATADATQKLMSAFPWMADSDVPLEQLGYDGTDLDRLKADRARHRSSSLAQALLGQQPSQSAQAAAATRGGVRERTGGGS